MYHNISCEDSRRQYLLIRPGSTDTLTVYIRHGEKPSLTDYDVTYTIPRDVGAESWVDDAGLADTSSLPYTIGVQCEGDDDVYMAIDREGNIIMFYINK